VCPPLAADVDAGVRLGALVAKSFQGRVNPVISDTAGLLEAVQRAIEVEDLAGVLAVVDAFRYTHVQFLLECAVEVRSLAPPIDSSHNARHGRLRPRRLHGAF
jgi:hypothetical protein